MKKISYISIFIVAFIFLSSACSVFPRDTTSSDVRYDKDNNSSSGTYTLKFTQKDESELHTIDMQEDGVVLFKFTSRVKEGNISFTLKDDQDKIIHEESGKRISFNNSFSFQPGNYYIILDYEDTENGNVKLEMNSSSYFKYSKENDDGTKPKEDK